MVDDRFADLHRSRKLSLAKSASALLSEARLDVSGPDAQAIARRLAEMPKTSRMTYLRAMRGRRPQMGIKAHCMECVGWDRREVWACTAPACPLYPYRPFREAKP